MNFIGIDSPGSMQARWIVPARTLVALPDEISLLTAALAEPTAVAVHDVRRAELDGGEQASSSAAGRSACWSRWSPVHEALRCSCSSRARVGERSARSLGLECVDPTGGDVDRIDDWTAGAGVQVGFEVSGATAGLETADPVARRTRVDWSSSRFIRNPRLSTSFASSGAS